jgi:hypothetical protein
MAKKQTGPKGSYIVYGNQYIVGNESIGLGGLSRDKYTKQHYCYFTDPKTGIRTKKKFSVDPDKAVPQYEQLAESLQGKKTVTFLKPEEKKSIAGKVHLRVSENITKVFEKLGLDEDQTMIIIRELVSHMTIDETSFVEDLIWKKARELIIKDPTLAAKKLGIQQIAYLDDLEPHEKPLSLKQIIGIYLSRKEGFVGYEKKHSHSWWKEFETITKATSTKDLVADSIERYENALWERYTSGRWAAKTMENRFTKIRAIVNYALKNRMTTDIQRRDLRRILDLCNFKYAEANEVDPTPIDPRDFQSMLQIAEERKDTRAILCILLAANGAYLPKEIGDIEKRHIDLENITIMMPPSKVLFRRQ